MEKQLRAALQSLVFCLDSPTTEVQRAAALFQPAIAKAKAVLKATEPKCNIGLFQDERQIDLEDLTGRH